MLCKDAGFLLPDQVEDKFRRNGRVRQSAVNNRNRRYLLAVHFLCWEYAEDEVA